MGQWRTSKRGLDLIKAFEGFRSRSVAREAGGYIVGYGHTKAARADVTLSREDAELLLRGYDLPPIEAAIAESVFAPLNQNEFDALVSFAFNVGIDAFKTCQVLSDLNAGKKLQAAAGMLAWRKARINGQLMIVDGLIRRRTAEVALMLEVPEGAPIVPSALVVPQLDVSAAIVTSNEGAVVVEARVEDETAKPCAVHQDVPVTAEPTAPAAAESAKGEIVAKRLTRILGEPVATSAVPEEPVVASKDAFKPAPMPGAQTPATLDGLPEPLPGHGVDIDDLETYDFGDFEPLVGNDEPPLVWQPMAFLVLLGIILLGSGLVKLITGAGDGTGFLQGILILTGITLSLVGGYYLLNLFRPRFAET